MANPRQRRKARSGKYTGATKSARRAANKRIKRAPTVMGPAVLREQWDPKLTVRQNYAKLGLVPTLSHQSGGLDPKDPYAQAIRDAAETVADENQPKPGMARIIRDEDGNVVDVIEHVAEEETLTPWGAELNKDESRAPSRVMLPPVLNKEKGNTVEELERLAAEDAPVKRYTSAGEHSWLADLVDAHGSDYEAMARDRRLNIMQKTAGEIRRAYVATDTRIRKAGGLEAFRQ
ncbi:Nucleolar protein 16 [Malassezia cuniculi]|uniref:Nucleolar protein 16 n=1 Tax=Malassezia cuniculi TaxID=948313 RepID=A0AAF0EWB6_9BASI|nr:Nucleolar protein 16 [Malassezia cuniculi]